MDEEDAGYTLRSSLLGLRIRGGIDESERLRLAGRPSLNILYDI